MPPAPAQLLDIPEDLLLRIAAHLPSREGLQLALVCSQLRDVLRQPTFLWSGVQVRLRTQAQRDSFRRWTATRGAAIEHLVLKIRDEPDAEQQPMLLPGWAAANAGCGAALRKLSVDWDGPVRLSGFDAAPSLQKLALFGVRLRVEGPLPDGAAPSLTDLSVVRGWVRGAGINSAWLPPSLTALILSGCSLRALPGAIRHLPKLRLLDLGGNLLEIPQLDVLSSLTALEHLSLSGCPLGRAPQQLAHLADNLLILYLQAITPPGMVPDPDAWEPLRRLRRLRFLSISENGLRELPPAVADMELHALQCERNRSLMVQPGAACLRSLQQLTVDWSTALSSSRALRAATQLSRLVLAGPGRHHTPGGRVNPIATAEALLEALAAMPQLQRVDEVCRVELTSQLAALSLPKVHAMWQLGRRCPRVQLGTLPSAEAAGWVISQRPGHRLAN